MIQYSINTCTRFEKNPKIGRAAVVAILFVKSVSLLKAALTIWHGSFAVFYRYNMVPQLINFKVSFDIGSYTVFVAF